MSSKDEIRADLVDEGCPTLAIKKKIPVNGTWS